MDVKYITHTTSFGVTCVKTHVWAAKVDSPLNSYLYVHWILDFKQLLLLLLHNAFAWTQHNNLTLTLDKTTYTLFTPDHTEYMSNPNMKINHTTLLMAKHLKILGLTLDPQLTYNTHIHNISVHVHNPIQIIKVFTTTEWDKQKEALMATYKAVMRPALEYASSIWSPLASSTSINKLQVMPNPALRTATWCTQDTNIQHLHDETLTLPTRAPTASRLTIQTEQHTSALQG